MNLVYKQEEFIFDNRGAVCHSGNGEDKITWYIQNRPNLSSKLIAVQIYNGTPDMSNPSFVALVNRIELAKKKAKPKPSRRGKPKTRAK